MTEAEWLNCGSLEGMLEFLEDCCASERKQRLFCCACCRRGWNWFDNEENRRAVVTSERYADGLATWDDLKRAGRAATLMAPSWMVTEVTVGIWEPTAVWTYGLDVFPWPIADSGNLIHDIFGNPFRPVVLNPVWQTREVLSLAQAAYDDRLMPVGTLDAERLSVLADALEDAGCTDDEILGHLRGPGPHVRGCWGVDLLLDKK
jgi:hypothetical protein